MPYTKSWLEHEEKNGGRMVLEGGPENIRNQYDQLIQLLLPHLPQPSGNVDVEEAEVEGVKYRVYNPKSQSGPLPVIIWTHGGGYMVGDLNSDHILCAAISEHTNTVVVNVDYRLTPEHKWPAQLEDGMKVYKWAHKNAASIRGDPKKFMTGGGSAGGGLAFQIANQVVRDPQLKDSLKGIIALVPLTCHWDNVPEEYQSTYKSYVENEKNTPIIDKNTMDIFYKGAEADPKDPDTFVLLATDNHKNYPPVYFASCEYDPLRDDSTTMIAALKKAGVPTKHDYYEGLPHYFWIFPWVAEGQQFVGNVMQGIGWLLSQM